MKKDIREKAQKKGQNIHRINTNKINQYENAEKPTSRIITLKQFIKLKKQKQTEPNPPQLPSIPTPPATNSTIISQPTKSLPFPISTTISPQLHSHHVSSSSLSLSSLPGHMQKSRSVKREVKSQLNSGFRREKQTKLELYFGSAGNRQQWESKKGEKYLKNYRNQQQKQHTPSVPPNSFKQSNKLKPVPFKPNPLNPLNPTPTPTSAQNPSIHINWQSIKNSLKSKPSTSPRRPRRQFKSGESEEDGGNRDVLEINSFAEKWGFIVNGGQIESVMFSDSRFQHFVSVDLQHMEQFWGQVLKQIYESYI